MRERVELPAAGLGGTDAGQCHRDRIEQPGDRQHQEGTAIGKAGRNGDGQRRQHGQGGGRQPAGEIAVQRLDPLHQQGGSLPHRAVIGRAEFQQPGEGGRAQPGAGGFPGGKLGAFLGQAKTGHQQGQGGGGGKLRPARAAMAKQRGQQPRHQPCLGDGTERRRQAEQHRQQDLAAQGPLFAPQQGARLGLHAGGGRFHAASLRHPRAAGHAARPSPARVPGGAAGIPASLAWPRARGGALGGCLPI